MAVLRLTGLEFQWFGKSQLLATDYEQSWRMDLELVVASFVSFVTEDAKTFSTGSQSLQKVAARLEQEAGEAAAMEVDAQSRPIGRVEADRRIAALCCLGAKFANAAIEVEAWKRDTSASSKVSSA